MQRRRWGSFCLTATHDFREASAGVSALLKHLQRQRRRHHILRRAAGGGRAQRCASGSLAAAHHIGQNPPNDSDSGGTRAEPAGQCAPDLTLYKKCLTYVRGGGAPLGRILECRAHREGRVRSGRRSGGRRPRRSAGSGSIGRSLMRRSCRTAAPTNAVRTMVKIPGSGARCAGETARWGAATAAWTRAGTNLAAVLTSPDEQAVVAAVLPDRSCHTVTQAHSHTVTVTQCGALWTQSRRVSLPHGRPTAPTGQMHQPVPREDTGFALL